MAPKKSKEEIVEVQKILLDAQDFLQNIVQSSLQQILESEFSDFIQAGRYERNEERIGYRNGSYTRHLKTRVGKIELHVCRDREGKFHSELFERYQRNEKAFVLSLVEMYLHGVSTRKVGKIVEMVTGTRISKSTISKLAQELDEQVQAWRNRPLEDVYPYLIVDARYEKVREAHRVKSKAVLIVIGIHKDSGKRSILAVEIGDGENEENWAAVFRKLRERGLKHVSYIVSDAHEGLKNGIVKSYHNATWQRCQVHFTRNFASKFSKRESGYWLRLLKDVFSAPDYEESKRRTEVLLDQLSPRHPKIADWLEENIEESLNVYSLPVAHHRQMRSTNMIERLNEELRRRSRVIRIFPNEASCLRLIGSLCMEYSEEWENGRRYLDMDLLKEREEILRDGNGRVEIKGFPLRSKPLISEKRKYTRIRT